MTGLSNIIPYNKYKNCTLNTTQDFFHLSTYNRLFMLVEVWYVCLELHASCHRTLYMSYARHQLWSELKHRIHVLHALCRKIYALLIHIHIWWSYWTESVQCARPQQDKGRVFFKVPMVDRPETVWGHERGWGGMEEVRVRSSVVPQWSRRLRDM